MWKTVDLPVGPRPGWELEEDDEVSETPELRSVAESLVVLQALRQSRVKWLYSIFPKFSTKTRGTRQPDIVPPPHTIKAHGRYDLKIGPHLFPNTAFYEVHYIPQPIGAPAPPPNHPLSQGPYLQQQPVMPMSALTGPSATPQSPPDVIVTPDLISQVNAASLSNPTLANLLQLAASGRATADQLKTLGLLIQSLGAANLAVPLPSLPPPPASVAPSPVPYTRRDFDLVIEFSEKPSDKWVLPRGPVVCRQAQADNSVFSSLISDVQLTTAVPFMNVEPPFHVEPLNEIARQNVRPEIVTFHIFKVPQTLWDVLVTWSGGEQGMEDSRRRLADLSAKAPKRVYLQHQLPEGPLLSQLQSAATPYTTKPIAPVNADSTRTRRKPTSRRVTIDPSAVTDDKNNAPKRRLSNSKMAAQLPPIACRSCGQTDVPLMMGGRYCRACIDAGKASSDVPQLSFAAGGLNSPGLVTGSSVHVFSQIPGTHTTTKPRRPSGMMTPSLHPSSFIFENPSGGSSATMPPGKT